MANSEASDRIETAFAQALHETGRYNEGDIMGEWVIVGYVDNPDQGTYGYSILYSNGEIAPHVTRGLLHQALAMVDNREPTE
jgi:hypothetical protein